MTSRDLHQQDPLVAGWIAKEMDRQEYGLELIPSENYVSRSVLEAAGSVLTNKYAEGLPHKRYYGGCEFVDEVEAIAIDRAKQLFGCFGANVQPHSGSQANTAAYLALINPGDTIMGMNLSHGGHLTHGSPVNFSGKFFKVVAYGVNPETELIDYNQVRDLATQHRPKLIMVGYSAYSRDLDYTTFRAIADEVGAYLVADIAHPAGLIAADLLNDPIPHCHVVTTTTHKTLRGPRAGLVMFREEFEKPINKIVFPGIQGGPLMHIIAAKAVALGEALQPSFKAYARQVITNTKALAEGLTKRGYRIVSGGTDNHLCLVDFTDRGISGKDAEEALGKAAITVNKNTIPRETRSPFVTSGIRLGAPAITTRGMKEPEMATIAGWIADVLDDVTNTKRQTEIRNEVHHLCERFPIYR
ncbi:MAG: serine hydroxymethyltransferase [Deltaproteobacteria bacterium]|nr:serine hydroxymethyltransferase [Deltaproteobacteria bacterium]